MSIPIPAELRQSVQERADGRCEYCRTHQDTSPFNHEIDHIVARKHGGQSIPKSNLGGLIAILSPDKMEAVKHAVCFW